MAGLIFDNSNGNGNGTTGTSATVSLTISSAGNRLLVVGIFVLDGDIVTGVTYNSIAMTQINKIQRPDLIGRWCYLYALVNPSSGTNNIIASTSISTTIGLYGASYSNAIQSGQPESNGTNTSTTSSISKTLTSTTDYDSHIGMFLNHNQNLSIGSNTSFIIGTTGGAGLYISTTSISPPGSNTITATTPANDNLCCVTGLFTSLIGGGLITLLGVG